jgi:flagellar hook-associated protein 2
MDAEEIPNRCCRPRQGSKIMSGITSSVGIFSGIDRNQLISQLLAIDARPKQSIQQRVIQLQGLSAAYLDVNSKVSSLRSIATSFRTDRAFDSARATTSLENRVRATATVGAPVGEYSVTVARLASTQRATTAGFVNATTTPVGAREIIVEPAAARIDRDTRLSDLNGGTGVQRGQIRVRDSSGTEATIDLRAAVTLNDVIDAINTNGTARVKASLDGDRLRLEDLATGTGQLVVSDTSGRTAADLGLLGSANNGQVRDIQANTNAAGTTSIRGKNINFLGGSTRLSLLNDSLGVSFNQTVGVDTADLRITTRDGSSFKVDLGETFGADLVRTGVAATTIQGVIDRINAASGSKVNARIAADGKRLEIVDLTTGADKTEILAEGNSNAATQLGLLGSSDTGLVQGAEVLTRLGTVRTERLNGGGGISDGPISITDRAGNTYNLNLNTSTDVLDLISQFNTGTSGRVQLGIDQSGTRFTLTDTTGGSGTLRLSGAFAELANIAGDFNTSRVIASERAQVKYVDNATRLTELNGGRGIGTGRFEITASDGTLITVNITEAGQQTVQDLVGAINSAGLINNSQKILASVNPTGDGILITDNASNAGRLSIRDLSGSVARNIGFAGTATGTGPLNVLNGRAEKRIELTGNETLTQISTKINELNGGITSSVINDGSANPFRLSIAGRTTGLAGGFALDFGAFDIGLSITAKAQDSVTLFGSADPSLATSVTSASNTLSQAVPGVTLDLLSAGPEAVNVSVTRDSEAILKKVQDFAKAFNDLIDSIASRSTFDSESNRRGVLLGDSATSEVRRLAVTTLQSSSLATNSQNRFLFEVGISVGTGGKVTVDETKLRLAIERDPEGVKELFSARDVPTSNQRQLAAGVFVNEPTTGSATKLGVFEKLADELERVVRASTGTLSRRTSTIDAQIREQNNRSSAIDRRIASRRATLERQFINMETSLGRLQGQQGSLNSIRNLST